MVRYSPFPHDFKTNTAGKICGAVIWFGVGIWKLLIGVHGDFTSRKRGLLLGWTTEEQQTKINKKTLGVTLSTVWYIEEKNHRDTQQQHQQAWRTMKHSSSGWLYNPLFRGEKSFSTSTEVKNLLELESAGRIVKIYTHVP